MRLRNYPGPEEAPRSLLDDPRSWSVETRLDGETVGEVTDVLLDEAGTARYLEIELDDDRRVLVPVGHTTLDVEDETVRLPGLARSAVDDIPPYSGEPATVDPAYEREVSEAWDRAYDDEGFYESPTYRSDWSRGRELPGERSAPVRVDTLDDVDVADHDHDPRGWEVVGSDGRRLGTVDHLMGDLDRMKVRYLTVDVDSDLVGDEDREILVPVGHATLEPDDERVRVDALGAERVRGCPVWTGTLDRPFERELQSYFARGYEADGVYGHPRYRTDPQMAVH